MQATLCFGSQFENIEIAELALERFLEPWSPSAEDLFWVQSALREAVSNAIRHGHVGDPEQQVRVQFTGENSVLTVTVADRGMGFNPETLPDPTDPDYLLKSHGRGIFCMKQFMDRVVFHQREGGGTMVEMTRTINDGNKES